MVEAGRPGQDSPVWANCGARWSLSEAPSKVLLQLSKSEGDALAELLLCAGPEAVSSVGTCLMRGWDQVTRMQGGVREQSTSLLGTTAPPLRDPPGWGPPWPVCEASRLVSCGLTLCIPGASSAYSSRVQIQSPLRFRGWLPWVGKLPKPFGPGLFIVKPSLTTWL